MEKLDKVIAALTCCRVNEDDPCEGNCPYCGEESCVDKVMDDALECLKDRQRKSGDLISRSALIKKCFPYGMPDGGNYPINARAVMEALTKAEAVEVEPVVHAHWVGDEPGDWHCSRCGEYAADGGFEQTKRCPHCGAKMDGERKDNERKAD